MTQATEKTFLEIPDIVTFGEEEDMLDYDKIVEQTQEAKKKAAVEKKVVPKEKIVLTKEESDTVDSWVKDLEKHISEWSKKASDKFLWDCSKVNTRLFYELAQRFKDKNPKFYVETHGGIQQLIVTWHGKNEV